MKKNKLLYILTILITLFTFNMNVRAANFEVKSYAGKGSAISCQGFARLTKELGLDSAALEQLDTTKYDLTCTYAKDYSYKSHQSNGGPNDVEMDIEHWGCHVIQFSVNRNGNIQVAYSFPVPNADSYNIENTAGEIINAIEKNGGMCPQQIYVSENITYKQPSGSNKSCEDMSYQEQMNANCNSATNYSSGSNVESINIGVSLDAGAEAVSLSSASGFNWVTGQNFKIDNMGYDLIGDKIDILNCEHLFSGTEGEDLKEIVKWIIRLVKIAIPVLLIGLGIMDFAKAVFSGKEDEMKKAQEKFIKRIIIGVCIFLIPTLITYILKLYNLVWDKNINTDFCGILK